MGRFILHDNDVALVRGAARPLARVVRRDQKHWIGALFAMWLIMAAAMMMPTFVPTLRVFLDLGHAGAARPTDALALVIGYVAIWVGGSLNGAVAQRFLAGLGLLAPDGSSLSLWLTATLLLGAGLYQFTPAKAACLAKCRMPLTYFMERWAPGLRQSLWMGPDITIAQAGKGRVRAYGRVWDFDGRSAEICQINWHGPN